MSYIFWSETCSIVCSDISHMIWFLVLFCSNNKYSVYLLNLRLWGKWLVVQDVYDSLEQSLHYLEVYECYNKLKLNPEIMFCNKK